MVIEHLRARFFMFLRTRDYVSVVVALMPRHFTVALVALEACRPFTLTRPDDSAVSPDPVVTLSLASSHGMPLKLKETNTIKHKRLKNPNLWKAENH